MAHFRHMIVIILQAALLAGVGTLALEVAPRVAAGATIGQTGGQTAPVQAEPEARADGTGHHALFDSRHCSAMPQQLKAAWAPDRANPQRDRLGMAAVSACPHFLSTMSLVKPHHVWRG
ncbi:hypothetical protein HUK83_13770 [Endobacter medicaginis]|uniref:Uncharacterized protein n=2 Tax=Endobacter medicaginis TaxID=1181271 RepID=A0A850NPA9_9PROT|nr:hypothetical protein [Endobacter medicaginis]MCX5476120.1 hypothetical protein [Endobacter medicaginis]NVN31393.1 hypothetical protein [Endobacter medicaginis]